MPCRVQHGSVFGTSLLILHVNNLVAEFRLPCFPFADQLWVIRERKNEGLVKNPGKVVTCSMECDKPPKVCQSHPVSGPFDGLIAVAESWSCSVYAMVRTKVLCLMGIAGYKQVEQ